MAEFIDEKEYLINIFMSDGLVINDIVMLGKDVESGITEIKKHKPSFKKIIVYDNETKDALRIIRS